VGGADVCVRGGATNVGGGSRVRAGRAGVQRSLPRGWTDAGDVDAFVAAAAGRCPFRLEDLLAVADVLDCSRDA
jgi:hypothetical protein